MEGQSENFSALLISTDTTFSDLRAAYSKVPVEVLKESSSHSRSAEREICAGPKVLVRLLTQFLHDPDIQARWTTEDGKSDLNNSDTKLTNI